jgi:hypothetical protein
LIGEHRNGKGYMGNVGVDGNMYENGPSKNVV